MCGKSKVYIFGKDMGISYTPRWGRGYGLKDSDLIGFRILPKALVHVFGELRICVHFPRMASTLVQKNILVLVSLLQIAI